MNSVDIIDYGMGNLHSVEKAFLKAGAKPRIITRPEEILKSNKICVPGVGAFGDCVENLQKLNLWQPILEFIKAGKPYLGICLGMQILTNTS